MGTFQRSQRILRGQTNRDKNPRIERARTFARYAKRGKKSVGKVGRDTVIPARAPLIVGKVTRSGSPFTTATMT